MAMGFPGSRGVVGRKGSSTTDILMIADDKTEAAIAPHISTHLRGSGVDGMRKHCSAYALSNPDRPCHRRLARALAQHRLPRIDFQRSKGHRASSSRGQARRVASSDYCQSRDGRPHARRCGTQRRLSHLKSAALVADARRRICYQLELTCQSAPCQSLERACKWRARSI